MLMRTDRLVTCVERRKSSAMASCRHVHIASITRRSVFSHRLRKREVLPKGTFWITLLQIVLLTVYGSAKYIEGLENRLGRMEKLLRMSGTSVNFLLNAGRSS